jgi:hypothetical protein
MVRPSYPLQLKLHETYDIIMRVCIMQMCFPKSHLVQYFLGVEFTQSKSLKITQEEDKRSFFRDNFNGGSLY